MSEDTSAFVFRRPKICSDNVLRWAANLLVFPQGEWLGLVKPEDVPSINSWATNALEQGARPLRLSDPPSFPAHWRGRMGLSKEEQKDLLAKYQT